MKINFWKLGIAAALAGAFLFTGCASSPAPKRVWLDSSTHSDDAPTWVQRTANNWEKDGKLHFRATHTVRGTERVNGCYDLARLDAKEKVLSEIATDLKGSIDHAQQSISESAEVVLGKVRSGQFEGRITGLKFPEEYYERYRIEDTERIDCHVLGEIETTDYQRTKSSVLDRVVAADARLKEAITQKQIDFFRDTRAPSATSGGTSETTDGDKH